VCGACQLVSHLDGTHILFPFPDTENSDALKRLGIKLDSKVVDLKKMCKDNGLIVSGKKSELQDRLKEWAFNKAKKPRDDYDSMTVEDLKHTLISRGLSTRGKKATLIDRLREDSKTIEELKQAAPEQSLDSLAHMLEEATKTSKSLREFLKENEPLSEKPKKKFVDVTITSLGLEPEKFTAGGAPSVTADVLRKLAGDPFADPPVYGSVSFAGNGNRGACIHK